MSTTLSMKQLMLRGAACGLTLVLAVPAQAQLNGSHILGDFGVQAGSQPAPRFYAALFYLRYDTDTIKDADGNTVRLAPDAPASSDLTAAAPLLWYVSTAKVLGANYGVMAVLPWANASLEAPAFGLTDTIGTSFADILVRPLDLGWHATRADVSAGFQFYAPTGRYQLGGSDNIGKGMWTYEPFIGTTLYFDEARTASLATTAFWEFHGKKEGSNVKVGQILSLEGGLGQVVPRGRSDHRRRLLRPMEADRGRARQLRAARRRSDPAAAREQTQGLRHRAGRDAADREPIDALRAGQHSLSLGNGRSCEDRRPDAGHHGDLPGSQRQGEMRGQNLNVTPACTFTKTGSNWTGARLSSSWSRIAGLFSALKRNS